MDKQLIIVLLLVLAYSLPAQNGKNNFVPIDNCDPYSASQDLAATKIFFADKKLIAFGEATHGTKEFFMLKHRFFKYLADSLQYKIVFMEAMYNSSQIVNDYILNGTGSQKQVMNAIGFDVYQTIEVWQLIEWLKEFNRAKPTEEKIRFYGIDMQAIQSGGLNLRKYVEKIDPTAVSQFDTIAHLFYSDTLIRQYSRSKKGIDPQLKAATNQKLKALENWFEKSKTDYIQKSNEQEFALLTYQVKTIIQAFDFYTKLKEGFRGISNFRDSCMAENLKFVLANYKASTKAMLWAHNQHIRKDKIFQSKPLGYYLQKYYQTDFSSIGFVFHEGRFRALRGPKSLISGVYKLVFTPKKVFSKDFENIEVKPLSTKKSLTKEMEQFKIPLYFLYFDNNLTLNKDFKWLKEPLEFYELGATYTFLHTNKLTLLSAFDGIIYVRKTTDAEPLDVVRR